ncbi:MAG TPA: ABC transporter permease [Burkholderiales bacterium]|jgi:lipopolysaccharide transport system permease protein
MSKAETTEEWTTTIDSARGWYAPDLRGLWAYRDLVLLFVRRDFVAVYKQSLLGPLWFVLQPLMTTLVFTVVFGNIASIPTDGLTPFLFYFGGVVCWQYFAANVIRTSDTFGANAAIFGKVYFPRLVTPASVVISNLVQFGIQFSVLACVLAWFIARGTQVGPTVGVLLLPLLLAQIAAFALGMGLAVSALTTRYRDLSHLIGFGMQLWMYATPIVYPVSQVPAHWQWLVYLNPMAAMVQNFRHMLLGAALAPGHATAYSAVATMAVLALGLALFSRVERTFMDTI